MKNKLYRDVAIELTNTLNNFFEKYHSDPSLTVTSSSSRLYNDFIVKSFSIARDHRYSISQLAIILKENNVHTEDIYYLILRYIDGMYLLATNNKIQEDFWP